RRAKRHPQHYTGNNDSARLINHLQITQEILVQHHPLRLRQRFDTQTVELRCFPRRLARTQHPQTMRLRARRTGRLLQTRQELTPTQVGIAAHQTRMVQQQHRAFTPDRGHQSLTQPLPHLLHVPTETPTRLSRLSETGVQSAHQLPGPHLRQQIRKVPRLHAAEIATIRAQRPPAHHLPAPHYCASPEPSTPKPKRSTTTRTTATPTPPQPLRAIAFRLLELGFTIAEHAGLHTHNIETAIARAYDLPGSSEPGTE